MRKKENDNTKVQVAIRVRPFIPKEVHEGASRCLKCFFDINQIVLGKDRSFNFDRVFDSDTPQETVYNLCARELVTTCFEGYNATILAYGQTGSGKTFTMGSSNIYSVEEKNLGIIPRVIRDIFSEVGRRKEKFEFIIKVSFLEIYNEEIHDLLDSNYSSGKIKNGQRGEITIREEKDGSINLYGLNEEKVQYYWRVSGALLAATRPLMSHFINLVQSLEEMMVCLEKGSLHRSTSSTLMNETSSRSHAIFSSLIEQHAISDLFKGDDKKTEDEGFMTAKFHFVDLAGSERIKKTGATGATLKEGISINRGLLSLGNVISALTEVNASGKSHVPYRDSKLTRILQDSLGGNARTFMIACVSPAETNYDETLNTMNYASRARNIKNKPVKNLDPHSALVAQMKQQIFELQNDIKRYRQTLKGANISLEEFDKNRQSQVQEGTSSVSTADESRLLFSGPRQEEYEEELKKLKIQNVKYEKEIKSLQGELSSTKRNYNEAQIELLNMQRDRDMAVFRAERIMSFLEEKRIAYTPSETEKAELESRRNLSEEYMQKIEALKQTNADQEKMIKELQGEYEKLIKSSELEYKILKDKTINSDTAQRKLIKAEKKIADLEATLAETEKRLKAAPNLNISILSGINECLQAGMDEDDEFNEARSDGSHHEILSVLESEELGEMEMNFRVSTNNAKKEIESINSQVKEKENLFMKMSKQHQGLQKGLIEDMKNEYHKKISQLEVEIKNLEKQNHEALNKLNSSTAAGDQSLIQSEKNRISANFKQKVAELEGKLKEYQRKDQEQKILIKQVQLLTSRIKGLDEEIKKSKTQRIELVKKLKEDTEKFDKWKSSRQKEMLEMKKQNLEKDAQITKLKNDNIRRELIFKKKEDLFSEYKKSQEVLKNLLSQHSSKPLGAKRTKNKKEISAILAKKTLGETLSEDEAKLILENLFSNISEHMREEMLIKKAEDMLAKFQSDLESEMDKYTECQLKMEKLQLELSELPAEDILESENLSLQINDLKGQTRQLQERIENLEAALTDKQDKIREMVENSKRNSINHLETLIFGEERIIGSVMNLRLLLKGFFDKLLELQLELTSSNDQLSGSLVQAFELKKDLESLEEKLRSLECQHERDMLKMQREFEDNYNSLIAQYHNLNLGDLDEGELLLGNNEEIFSQTVLKKIEEELEGQEDEEFINGGFLKSKDSSKRMLKRGSLKEPISNSLIYELNKDRKDATTLNLKKLNELLKEKNLRLENLLHDATKKQQNSDRIADSLKRKVEVLKSKYDVLKKQGPKEKIHHKNASQSNFSEIVLNDPSSPLIIGPRNMAQNPLSASVDQLNIFQKTVVPTLSVLREKKDGLTSLKEKRKQNKITKKDANNNSNDSKTDISNAINEKFGLPVDKRPRAESHFLLVDQSRDKVFHRKTPSVELNYDSENSFCSGINEVRSNTDDRYTKFGFDDSEPHEETKYDIAQMKPVSSVEAHQYGVYCLTSYGNVVYSSSNKEFKVWGIEDAKVKLISTINAHSSFVKAMAIWPEKNLLATACDKLISLWDLISLKNVYNLKGHKDEIRNMEVFGDYLYSTGKGNPSGGALLTWDLRSLNYLEEREKNQDIFSMTCHNNILYLGSRNHQIRRINVENMESLAPLIPPHYDTVTSLISFKDQLISGSRDKTLKLWNIKNPIPQLISTEYIQQECNVLEKNVDESICMSGSRDGYLKFWGLFNDRLRSFADVNAHTASINAICNMNQTFSDMIVTGSADKYIKIWRINKY